jgi:mannose-6-phosphate isomerase-like protein (cupin superfamily)
LCDPANCAVELAISPGDCSCETIKPQSFTIEHATKENTNYRSVAWSGRYLQVTLMSIPVGEDIGLEAHPETDQFLRLDAGRGRVQMGAAKDKLTFEKEVSDG